MLFDVTDRATVQGDSLAGTLKALRVNDCKGRLAWRCWSALARRTLPVARDVTLSVPPGYHVVVLSCFLSLS